MSTTQKSLFEKIRIIFIASLEPLIENFQFDPSIFFIIIYYLFLNIICIQQNWHQIRKEKNLKQLNPTLKSKKFHPLTLIAQLINN